MSAFDPRTEFAGRPWHELAGAAAGRPAVIIGKGPSLDAWLQHEAPTLPSHTVCIGINHAAALHPCHFGVTCHGEHEPYADIPTVWCVSLPIGVGPARLLTPESWRKPAWAHHWFAHAPKHDDPEIRDEHLGHTRSQIADLHTLWNCTSSAHPGIHLAWYLGCQSLTLVGCEGAHGYAQAVQTTHSPPVNKDGYFGTRRNTDRACARLYGTRWQHWAKP